jgi:epoxyqueuosine reductase
VPALLTIDDSQLLCDIGRQAGLDAVGVTHAEPFVESRSEIDRRKALGMHAGMAFTFRNPERSTTPAATMPDAQGLVVGALGYHRVEPPRPHGPSGRVARYSWSDHYDTLRTALSVIADALRSDGWRAIVLADDNALVDRAAAQRAGLGWFGKNANLLLPGRGSWYVLGSVLTDAPLVGTGGRVADGCGSCTRCLDGCPTDAIVAPGVVDARRCLAWLVQAPGTFPREHRVALGDRIYGCDDCQEVCPPNRRAERDGQTTVSADEVLDAWVPLVQLLDATDDQLLERYGRWYIPRRDPTHLRRNALIALGNVAEPSDPEVVRALSSALAHPQPLVRGHAVWAARRLGLEHLCSPLAADVDPLVIDELRAEVPPRRGDR